MKEQIKKHKVTDQICAWIFPNKKNYPGINISLNSRESLLSLFQIMLKFQYSSVNEIQLNQDTPYIYQDISLDKWPYENYFKAGNYLTTTDSNAFSYVKYYTLSITH